MKKVVGVIDLSYIFALFLFYYIFNCVPVHGQYEEDFAKNHKKIPNTSSLITHVILKGQNLGSSVISHLSGFFFMRTWSMYKYLRSRFILNKSQLLRTLSLK